MQGSITRCFTVDPAHNSINSGLPLIDWPLDEFATRLFNMGSQGQECSLYIDDDHNRKLNGIGEQK